MLKNRNETDDEFLILGTRLKHSTRIDHHKAVPSNPIASEEKSKKQSLPGFELSEAKALPLKPLQPRVHKTFLQMGWDSYTRAKTATIYNVMWQKIGVLHLNELP